MTCASTASVSKIRAPRLYIMLNKPMGVVTAVTPQHQETRQTVRDLIPIEGHLYPAGRLDADSEGLVLMTNDGDLAERLTHPRYQKAKVYEVTVLGRIPDEALEIWSRGVMLDDGMTLPVQIKVLSRDSHTSKLQITMTEGRKTPNSAGGEHARLSGSAPRADSLRHAQLGRSAPRRVAPPDRIGSRGAQGARLQPADEAASVCAAPRPPK